MHIHEGSLEVVFLTFKSDITGFNFLLQCELLNIVVLSLYSLNAGLKPNPHHFSHYQ